MARVRLSSDPDKYPLEPLIAPLVFELKKLGVFFPCWSCEGHSYPSGELWKLPSVWFYSDSTVHLRALSVAVGTLSIRRMLSTRWHIAVTHSDDDNADTTFCLEPVTVAAGTTLSCLQQDISVISARLADEFRQACARLRGAERRTLRERRAFSVPATRPGFRDICRP